MAEPKLELVQAAKKLTDWGNFLLFTDIEGLSAYLSCSLMRDTTNEDNLRAVLAEFGICQGIVEDNLPKMVALAAEGKPAELVKIAQGQSVVEGRDAYIEFHKRPVGQQAEISASDTRVDYREINSFDNVRKGDHVATFMPVQEGQGGADVFGRVILPKKVKDLVVNAGENVVYQSATQKFFADHDGYVVFEKGKVSVDPVYRVKGNLDLSHGNIRFIGRVEVERDVPDEYEVCADEGIAIGGTAEACVLRSKKDIVIGGGVTGKGKGLIECGGSFSARFINDAQIYCDGDVRVEREIVNSKVFAMGRVIINRGAIFGSEVVALRGIMAQDAGSDLGVKTTLIAGLDYHFEEKLMGINRDLVTAEVRQQELLDKIGPMLTQALKAPMVDNRVREQIDDMVQTIRSLQRQIERLNAESGDIMRNFSDRAVNCITVTRNCYPGVTAVVGKYEYVNKMQVTGMISLSPDEDRKTVHIGRTNSLDKYWGLGGDMEPGKAAGGGKGNG